MRLPTRCDNPLAPPPPKTNPIDLPHNLLAKRAKSFICGALCCRAVGVPRYFWISFCTLSFRFFNAATATGSCNDCVGRVGNAKPYLYHQQLGSADSIESLPEARHEDVDVSKAGSVAWTYYKTYEGQHLTRTLSHSLVEPGTTDLSGWSRTSSLRAVIFIDCNNFSYSPRLGSSPIPITMIQSAYDIH